MSHTSGDSEQLDLNTASFKGMLSAWWDEQIKTRHAVLSPLYGSVTNGDAGAQSDPTRDISHIMKDVRKIQSLQNSFAVRAFRCVL